MIAAEVCQLRDSTGLNCAKMAEQIKRLFGANTAGGRWNIVLDGVLVTPQRKEGRLTFKFCDPLVSRELLKLEAWNFEYLSRSKGPNKNYAKIGHAVGAGHTI